MSNQIDKEKNQIRKYSLPYFREYLLSLKNNNYSVQTLKNYERDLEIFESFLFYIEKPFEKLEKVDIIEFKGFLRDINYIPVLHAYFSGEDLSQEVLDKAKNSISEKKRSMYKGQLSDNSVNRMLSALRSYLSLLDDIDKSPPISSSAIKLIKAEKKEKQVAEFEELINLIESPMTLETDKVVQKRNRAILELIFSTGMRISEVVGLEREHIKMINMKIADNKMYIRGKGKKDRFVYLTERSIQFLQTYLDTRVDNFPAMFIPNKGTRRSTQNPYIVRLS